MSSPRGGELPQIRTDDEAVGPAQRYRRRAPWPRKRLLAVGGAAVLVVGMAVLAWLAATREKVGVLVLDWPVGERQDAGLDIDGQTRQVPDLGGVAFRLPEGNHRVIIRRPKFEQIEVVVALVRGQEVRYKPDWKPLFLVSEEKDDQGGADRQPPQEADSVGSGFVVSSKGYILTNEHVITGPGTLIVRLPSPAHEIPAQIVAQDVKRDIALLKVDVPAEVELAPLTISSLALRRAEEVGAFGYPLGESVGSGVKFSVAFVHATEEQTEQGMVVLDGRVNPGNSGGPLCSKRGQVVGMVTRKSIGGLLAGGVSVESYGMALPGKHLQEFLQANLPDYAALEETAASQPALDWAEVDRVVSPSVVMVINAR